MLQPDNVQSGTWEKLLILVEEEQAWQNSARPGSVDSSASSTRSGAGGASGGSYTSSLRGLLRGSVEYKSYGIRVVKHEGQIEIDGPQLTRSILSCSQMRQLQQRSTAAVDKKAA